MTSPTVTAVSELKPNYVRPMDLHAHTDGCDDKRKDGSTYCIPVYTAADYLAQSLELQAVREALERAEKNFEWLRQCSYSDVRVYAKNSLDSIAALKQSRGAM